MTPEQRLKAALYRARDQKRRALLTWRRHHGPDMDWVGAGEDNALLAALRQWIRDERAAWQTYRDEAENNP